jgi:hypothetical protein
MWTLIIGITFVGALAFGIWVGLGMPGRHGREDRVVQHGRARRLEHRRIDWLRPPGR